MAKADTIDSTATQVATQTSPGRTLLQQLASQAEIESGFSDPNIGVQLQGEAIDRMAQASTLDEMFEAAVVPGMPGNEEAATKGPLTITEIEFRKSREGQSSRLGFYAVMHCVTDNGEAFDWSSGSPNIVSFMGQLQRNGFLDKADKPRVAIKAEQRTNGIMYSVVRP